MCQLHPPSPATARLFWAELPLLSRRGGCQAKSERKGLVISYRPVGLPWGLITTDPMICPLAAPTGENLVETRIYQTSFSFSSDPNVHSPCSVDMTRLSLNYPVWLLFSSWGWFPASTQLHVTGFGSKLGSLKLTAVSPDTGSL